MSISFGKLSLPRLTVRGSLLLLGLIVIIGSVLLFFISRLFLSYDYLIINVRYVKEKEITSREHVVGIRDERIAYIGTRKPFASFANVIDGKGLVLAPGFVDVDSPGFVKEKAAYFKAHDGITTYLSAHGGLPRESMDTYGEDAYLNYATTVGIIGFRDQLDKEDFDVVLAFKGALQSGAYGISFSPEYTRQATPELIERVCKAFEGKSVVFSFHLRYSDAAHELEGVKEALKCASHDVGLHILHINSTGGTYQPEEAVHLVEAAQQRGVKVIYDFYPYTAWKSGLRQGRFDGDWMARYRVGYDRLRFPKRKQPLSKEEFDRIWKSGLNLSVIVDSIPSSTIDFYAKENDAPIGTDEAGFGHPRGIASFGKFIHQYAKGSEREFALAVYRFSTAPAKWFSQYISDLKERGLIQVGNYADLALWNLDEIKDNASYGKLAPTSGVVALFVNGTPLILDGQEVRQNNPPGKWFKGRLAR